MKVDGHHEVDSVEDSTLVEERHIHSCSVVRASVVGRGVVVEGGTHSTAVGRTVDNSDRAVVVDEAHSLSTDQGH